MAAERLTLSPMTRVIWAAIWSIRSARSAGTRKWNICTSPGFVFSSIHGSLHLDTDERKV